MAESATNFLVCRAWGSAEHAEAIRTAVLTIWLIIIVGTPYSRYAAFPVEALGPYGFGPLLRTSPTPTALLWSVPTLVGLQGLAALGCLVALILPKASPVAIPTTFVSVFLLDQLTKSLGGFPNHAQIAPLLVLGIVAVFSDAGFRRPWPFRDSRGRTQVISNERHNSLVWLSAVALVIPYTYIGTNRLIVGGPDMFTGDTLVSYLAGASKGFSSYPVSVDVYAWRNVLNAGFAVTTLLEISSVGLLVFNRGRMVWLLAITSFHVAILLFMNIAFWENVVLLWVVFWWRWSHGRSN